MVTLGKECLELTITAAAPRTYNSLPKHLRGISRVNISTNGTVEASVERKQICWGMHVPWGKDVHIVGEAESQDG